MRTLDAACVTALGTHASGRRRLGVHLAKERAAPAQYTLTAPLPSRMRLVVFTVSSFGALGPAAHGLLRELSRRVGHALPVPLLDEACWAAPRFAPYARMALTFAARRGLARSIGVHWGTRAQAAACAAGVPAVGAAGAVVVAGAVGGGGGAGGGGAGGGVGGAGGGGVGGV